MVTDSPQTRENERWRRFEQWLLGRPPVHPAKKLVLGTIVAGVLAGLVFASLFGLDWVVGSRSTVVSSVVMGVFLVFTAVAVVMTRFYRLWVSWRRDDRVFSDIYGSVMLAFAVLTVAAVSVEVLIDVAGRAELDWVPADAGGRENPTGEAQSKADFVWVSAEYFVWNFLDGIPVLKVTESVNWNRDRTFEDHWSGSVLLLYKLAVILPIVALVVRSLRPKPVAS